MAKQIEKVAILGAGVMGSQLAAFFTNVGIPVLLFDIKQELSKKGILVASSLKPAPFYEPKSAKFITPCNYDEHLYLLKKVDWVIEAIAERLDFKHALYKQIEPALKKDAYLTSNTSGLSISDMASVMSIDLQKRFLVTHFFNPPRYLHLLEIIPGLLTEASIVKNVSEFSENVLGKGVVLAKDTANFIANRIGVFNMMITLKLAQQMNLTVEEVDKLTGQIAGRPKSATFRTADVVGLDTLAHVTNTVYEKCPQDEKRNIFKVPEVLKQLLKNGALGAKSGKGFYQKAGREILSLNFETLEYVPQKKVEFEGYNIAKRKISTTEKIAALAYSNDMAGKFFWELIADTLIYAANRIPEIADNIISVDNALKWGFGWELGPFETWDALGVKNSVKRMQNEKKEIPQSVEKMLSLGRKSFYEFEKGETFYFDLIELKPKQNRDRPKCIDLKKEKQRGKLLKESSSANLIDLGDGIACIEFASKIQPQMNPIDASIIDLLNDAVEFIHDNGYQGLVIGSQGQNFTAGANLALILEFCKNGDYASIERTSKLFQDICKKLKFAPFPVIAAPYNLCLGGGFEIIGAVDKIVACAELYCGAVEVGIGLIPGGGGNLRLLLNWMDRLAPLKTGPFPPVQKTFETIAYAKVSTSAKQAISLGYLTFKNKIVVNPEHILWEAKQACLELSEDYQIPKERDDIFLPGEGGRIAIETTIDGFIKAGTISPHDGHIAKKLAYVLTGGDEGSPHNPVSEQYLLDIEREAFLNLATEKLTQDRIEYMLKTGKPLRN
jgi:3-hydroxyacyl-CoA dehydrogenase